VQRVLLVLLVLVVMVPQVLREHRALLALVAMALAGPQELGLLAQRVTEARQVLAAWAARLLAAPIVVCRVTRVA
jgi:hypothetical protein